uniref:Uncharacterized protein n=1 Tax=Chlamydomonas euryale TaxID=1486919 RepID=A0A7R9VAZ5_9CHLO
MSAMRARIFCRSIMQPPQWMASLKRPSEPSSTSGYSRPNACSSTMPSPAAAASFCGICVWGTVVGVGGWEAGAQQTGFAFEHVQSMTRSLVAAARLCGICIAE